MIVKISILGCGWLGLPLAIALKQQGYEIKGSTTRIEKLDTLTSYGIEPYLICAGHEPLTFPDAFFDTDLLIITIPPGNKSGLGETYASRINEILQGASRVRLNRVIMISSTAVYADSCRDFDEDDTPEPDTAGGRNVRAAELLVTAYSPEGTLVRCGGLVGPGRDPGRFFAGKRDIPNGQAPVNMLELEDAVSLISAIVKNEAFGGTYNACSPSHPERQQYYARAALLSGLEPPDFIPEKTSWKRVQAKNAFRRLGFSFSALEGFPVTETS
ncbi:NAD-dependent epimerase/dehydratase family protein [Pedobacter sp. SYP-B3415]|uniref:NAD-dependent epimerase/dehydratase family protein n=1 Tax=Pedobacter sp. SYP-B3415 TaxID=2496641 RepID=UPI00101DDCA8|nr:NAD-dependent epimerase/dehydratase family protein [Pedobacter sp. SYP-B3415]